jgi:CheY-like chemotaxis protein
MQRILVIDDDDLTRAILREWLQTAGYEVSDTNSGESALGILQSEAIDLVITDIMMPAKDGLQTILEIRRLPQPFKIIAISSGGSTNSTRLLQVAKSFGAISTLMKPFSEAQIVEAVTNALQSGN